MRCRPSCGACCIAPSIRQPFFGMPQGKAAGVRCVHLDGDQACGLFGDSRRPALCAAFMAEREICGENRDQALLIISDLEVFSNPESGPQ